MNTNTLNLRQGPGSKYNIIKTLLLNQELIFLAMTGNWVKVKTKEEETLGFVYYEYVVVLDN